MPRPADDSRPSTTTRGRDAARSQQSDDTESSRQSDDAERSRRSLLAGAGATLAGAASTAGCTELLPPLGREVRREAVTPPDRGPPAYRRYVPAPRDDATISPDVAALPSLDVEATTGVPWTPGRAFLASRIDYFGVEFGDYERVVSVRGDWPDGWGNGIVFEGPIARDEVGAVLRGSGYRADGSRGGYDRYVREDVPRTVEVTDGRLLFGVNPRRDEVLAAIRESAEGGRTLADADEAFRTLTDRAGRRAFQLVGTDFSGFTDDYEIRWFAGTIDFDADDHYTALYFRYADAVPSRDELASAAEYLTEEADALEIGRDGRSVSVEVRQPHATITPDQANPSATPVITWGVEASGDDLLVRHEAGASVPADRLKVAVGWDGEEHVPADVQFADDHETVAPGDALRVPRSSVADELDVRYVTDDGVTMLRYDP